MEQTSISRICRFVPALTVILAQLNAQSRRLHSGAETSLPASQETAGYKLIACQLEKKATFIVPMLLLRRERLQQGPAWTYEIKLDGYRAVAIKNAGIGKCRLSDSGTARTAIQWGWLSIGDFSLHWWSAFLSCCFSLASSAALSTLSSTISPETASTFTSWTPDLVLISNE